MRERYFLHGAFGKISAANFPHTKKNPNTTAERGSLFVLMP